MLNINFPKHNHDYFLSASHKACQIQIADTLSGFDTHCSPAKYSFSELKEYKKSAKRGVAPAGIKSHKFLFVLKKICFASQCAV